MLMWGRDTMRDASFHMSSITLAALVLVDVSLVLAGILVVLAAPAAWSRPMRDAHLPSTTLFGVIVGYVAYLIYQTAPFLPV
jgi:hypothetical protein